MDKQIEVLIMTVGLPGEQGDILDVLELDLEELKPARLAVVCSPQSLKNGKKLIERSGLDEDHTESIVLDGPNDINEVFRQTSLVIQRMTQDGASPENIAINYTSGTKVMGAGVVLAALYNRVRELRYITGISAAQPGSRHRILTTHPSAIFGYRDLIAARGMALVLRFRSALDVIEEVDAELLTPEDQTLGQQLQQLITAYGYWDEFQSAKFVPLYNCADLEHARLKPFRLDPGQLEAIEKLGAEMETGSFGPGLIVDIYNNAVRRWMVGRTDDAIARLYRAMEMLAQWILMKEFEIDTNNIQTRKIPPRDRVAFEALRSIEDGVVRVGLRKAYELLSILEHDVGVKFKNDPALREFLKVRGETILAHGMRTATNEECERFIHHTRELFSVEIENFDEMSRLLQFPWLLRQEEYGSITPGGAK